MTECEAPLFVIERTTHTYTHRHRHTYTHTHTHTHTHTLPSATQAHTLSFYCPLLPRNTLILLPSATKEHSHSSALCYPGTYTHSHTYSHTHTHTSTRWTGFSAHERIFKSYKQKNKKLNTERKSTRLHTS